MKLIDKDKFEMLLVRLKKQHYNTTEFQSGYIKALSDTLSILDTLEVKEVDFWHLQSKEDIDNVLVDWGLHTFVCLMKDGTIQKFSGIQAECYDGTINKHLDCADDNYEWEYNDIVYWIEVPNIKAQKRE